MKVRALAFALACGAALGARADVVQFKNGDRLTGKVLELREGKLGFDSKLAGVVSIPWAEIETFSTDAPVTIQLNDGAVVVDTIAAAEPGTVQTAGSGNLAAQTITLSAATRVNPEPVNWKGTAVAGASFDRGNTRRTLGTLGVDAVRRGEDDRITFGAGYIGERSFDEDEDQDITTKRQMFGALQYDLFFTPKWYGLATSRAEKDGVAELALRLSTGVGMGYQFVETDALKFNVELGPTWISENFSDDTEDNDYIAARIAWNLDWKITSGLEFYHRGREFPSFEDAQDQLLQTTTGLRYKIWADFFGESKVIWNWDSTPAEDKKRQDLSVILGIGYGF